MPLALFLLLAAPQGAPAVCSAPVVVAGVPVVAGRTYSQMPALTPGERAEVTLADTAGVTYLAMPEHAPPPGSKGGLVKFAAATAGTYRVALGTGAWIDVLDAKAKPVASAAHAHGAACSGIRKTVDFKLAPGTYALQLSGSKDARAAVTVTRFP